MSNIKTEKGSSLPILEKEIDQERINGWARISGDYNPLHVDLEYARNTPFKGTIAHGPMSLAFLNELLMSCFGERWAEGGQLLDVRFVSPVRPGDRLKICGVIKDVFEKNKESYAEYDLYIEKQDGVKAVLGRAIARI